MSKQPVMDACRGYWCENMEEPFDKSAVNKVVEIAREHDDGSHEMPEDVRQVIFEDFQEWVDNLE